MKTTRQRFPRRTLIGTLCALALAPTPAITANVDWLGGAGDWFSAANWSGGAYPGSFADVARIDAGNLLPSSVTLSGNVGIGGLEISAGDALVLVGGTLTLAGNVTSAGLLQVGDGISSATLVLNSHSTFGGAGQTVLLNGNVYGQSGQGTETLTIGASHTLRGGGNISSVKLLNQGSIVADSATTLSISTSGDDGFVNQGVVEIRDGSFLSLSGVMSGGELKGAVGSRIGGGGILDGVTLTGTVSVVDGYSLAIRNTITVTDAFKVGNLFGGTLYLAGNATLAGSGQTVLESAGIYGQYLGTEQLTIAAGHTLRGSGNISSVKLLNQGSIVADSTSPLYISTSGDDGFVNQGVVEIKDGSFLSLSGVMSGGELKGAVGSRIGGGGILDGVTLTGTVSVIDGTSMAIRNTLTVTDTFKVGNLFGGTLYLAGNATLAGSGQTVLESAGIYGQYLGTEQLTIAAGHTLRGSGNISSVKLLNQGSIVADSTSPLYISTSGDDGFVNQGVVEIKDGSFLSLSGVMSGGELKGAVGSRIGGGGILDGVTLTGTASVVDGYALAIRNTITVTDAFKVGNLFGGTLYLAGDATLAGAGQTILENGSIYGQYLGTERLTIAAGHTLRGSGNISSVKLLNQGSIVADSATTLSISTSGDDGFINQGVVEIKNGSLLSLSGVMSGGELRVAAGGRISGGILDDVTLTGVMSLTDGLSISIRNTITVTDTLKLGNLFGGTLYLAGDATLAGAGQTILENGSIYGQYLGTERLTIAAGHTLRGSGNISSVKLLNQGSIVADSATTLSISTSGDDGFINQGVVEIKNGSLLSLSGVMSGGELRGAVGSRIGGGGILDGVTLTGTVSVVDSYAMAIRNTITVTDTLKLGNLFGGTLYLAGDATLAGAGQTILENGGIYGQYLGTERLTIAAGHTLRGTGNLSGLRLVNQGSIVTDENSYLSISTPSEDGFANDGSVDVRTGSSLYLSGGGTSTGVLVVRDGGYAAFSGSFVGGTIQGETTSRIAGGTIRDITLAGTLNVRQYETLTIAGTITNPGTLRIGDAITYAYLQLAADTTLSGAGQTILDNAYVSAQNGTDRLTIAAVHTLRGQGSMSSLAFTNQGSVLIEGGSLSISTNGSGGFNNAGNISVQAGQISISTNGSGNFLNSGTIEVKGGGSLALSVDGSATGTLAVRDGGYAAFSGSLIGGTIQGESTSRISGGVLRDLSLAGTLNVRQYETLAIAGTITNPGTLRVGDAITYAYLQLAADTTLSGAGQTILDNAYISAQNGTDRLTIAADHTLRGYGSMSNLSFTNQGSVIVEGGALSISTSGPGSFMNSGTIEVKDGGSLSLSVDGNATGSLIVSDGGYAVFSGSLVGGAIQGETTSRIAGGVLRDVTLAGTLNVRQYETLVTAGTITNTGILRLGDAGTYGYLQLAADTTLSGAGQTVLDYGLIAGQNGTDRLTIAAGHTLRGYGSMSSLALTNQGSLIAEGGQLSISTNGTDSFLNTGTIEVKNGSSLSLSADGSATGMLIVRDGGYASFSGSLVGGTIHGETTSRIAGGVIRNVTLLGTLNVSQYEALLTGGTITNYGTLRIGNAVTYGSLQLASNTTLAGSGQTVLDNGYIYGQVGGETLTIAAGHTVRGYGNLQSIDVVNRGRLEVATGDSIAISGGALVQDETAAVTRIDGLLYASIDLSAGAVQGTGTLVGSVVQTGGSIEPGNSVGKLTIDGALTQTDGATLFLEFDGPVPGTGHDWLALSGNAMLDGRLRVAFGYAPNIGDTFVVITTQYGTVSGTFDEIVGANGFSLIPTYGPNDVTLRVAAVPEPGTYALMLAGLVFTGWAARRRRLARREE